MKLLSLILGLVLAIVCTLCEPIPQIYTQSFNDSKIYGHLALYSHDQTSMVSASSSMITFRASMDENVSKVFQETFFYYDGLIFAITYNPQKNLLFALTPNSGSTEVLLFAWKVVDKLVVSDRYLIYSFGLIAYNAGIDVSAENKIAICYRDQLVVLSLSDQMKATVQFQGDVNYKAVDVKWHPRDKQILFVSSQSDPAINVIFNLTSNISRNFDELYTRRMSFIVNGQLLLMGYKNFTEDEQKVNVYRYYSGKVEKAHQFNDSTLLPGFTSIQSSTFAVVRNNSQLSIIKATRDESLTLTQSQSMKENSPLSAVNIVPSYSFKQIHLIDGTINITDGSISRDGNQVYVRRNNSSLEKWTLCGDGNYMANGECLKCSEKCITCHQAEDKCTTCPQNHYLKNQKCFLCTDSFLGCIQCNYNKCLKCNTSLQFISSPKNGSCACLSNAYSINEGKQCRLCRWLLPGCQKCSNSDRCQACIKDNHFVYDQPNGKCVCEDGYSLEDGACEQKSYLWIAFVVGGVVVLGLGVFFGVKIYKKRKLIKKEPKEDYAKLTENA